MSSSAIIHAKRLLLKALAARKIAIVEISYDGEGDSGQIQDIQAADAKNQKACLDRPIKISLRERQEPTRYGTLHEALDDFAWMVLEEYHCGFENNDGGFGTITINVGEGGVTLDHNDRFTDVVNNTTEV